LTNMFKTKSDYSSLVFRVEQWEQNQQVMVRYMAEMKHQLASLSDQFNNRPERKQLNSLQDALSQLQRQFEQLSAPTDAPVKVVNLRPEVATVVDEIQPQSTQVQSYEYQLVFDRSGSRAVLISALLKAQSRLIIVCPWLSRNSIDADLMQKFRDCLNRNCRIDIGWGSFRREQGKTGLRWGNSALQNLRQLEQDYPEQFKLKLLGTHEKFLVCDDSIAMLGSHNMLTSNAQGVAREVGIRTTDPQIIQGLINRFDSVKVQAIDENLTADSVSHDDVEADDDTSARSSQLSAVDAKELLRRYKAGERDFTGINLARVDLTSTNLDGALLIEANLSGTNLNKAKLQVARLLQANLNKADLSEANLYQADLTAANLSGAILIQADLSSANLPAANLSGAILMQANLYQADLTAANLSGAILMQADLRKANLTAVNLSKAKLTNAILHGTNLSGANLTGVTLIGLNFQNTNLSGASLSEANLCGAYLGYRNLSGVNLTKADLRGANLEGANLEKANLTRANLGGANLIGAKLSGAIMPDGTVHD